MIRLLLTLPVLAALSSFAAETDPKTDARYPYRTDFANAELPWYQLKPGEFPPMHSDHRITGELIAADYIHRTGCFREAKSGALHDFSLLPFAIIRYLNAPADLRDVPLGTTALFALFPDENGAFTKAGMIHDEYTILAGHSFSYRLDEVKLAEGKLLVTTRSLPKNQPDLGHNELGVTSETRVWKGDRPIPLTELAAGDSLLVNLTGRNATTIGRCTDIWVGEETHQLVNDAQRAKHAAFIKLRGLPALVDRVEGPLVTVTFLAANDPDSRQELQAVLDADFAVGKALGLAVANDELRTYNVPVDKMRTNLVEIKKSSPNGMGNSGVKLVLKPYNLLEGFRQNRVVRIFSDKWPADDMPWGETLSAYRQHTSAETHENLAKEMPAQFPFRTDYGNFQLPWYRLEKGVVPPPFSEHCLTGELTQVDAAKRAGQFRQDRTGQLVDFTLTPDGGRIERITQPKAATAFKFQEVVTSVLYHNAEADLSDVPLGTRCRFQMYQDEHGAFTRASLVMDEFTYLALNQVTYRVDALKLDEGRLEVGRQIPPPLDYHSVPIVVPDLGRRFLDVDDATRVWKGGQPAKLTDLAPGDALLVNLTGEKADAPSRCTELWIGPESQQLATQTQAEKHPAPAKAASTARSK